MRKFYISFMSNFIECLYIFIHAAHMPIHVREGIGELLCDSHPFCTEGYTVVALPSQVLGFTLVVEEKAENRRYFDRGTSQMDF